MSSLTRRSFVLAAAMLLGAVAPAPVAAAAPDPVMLVHGYRGDASTWADMAAYLTAHGRTVYAIDLPGEDNVQNANAIAQALRRLHWKTVDLVGQSMGGLSTRWFAKYVKSSTDVDAYVSLGTPQYGIWTACRIHTAARCAPRAAS
jgi:triacylglycerol lipase